MSSKKDENIGYSSEYLEYDTEALYELLGSTFVATSLIITHKRYRGVKKMKFKHGEVDYKEIGKEKFNEYISFFKKDVCRKWNENPESFGEGKNSMDFLLETILKTDIPDFAAEIVSIIIIKMGFEEFCNFED